MRIPVSFDMLDPALCCLEDIKTPLFVEKSFFFMATFFVVESVYKFHHTMLVLNAFPAIYFRGLRFKNCPGKHAPGRMSHANALRSQVSRLNSKLAAQFSLRQSKLPPPPQQTYPSGLIWSVSSLDRTSA